MLQLSVNTGIRQVGGGVKKILIYSEQYDRMMEYLIDFI